jgi:hypothetical protein
MARLREADVEVILVGIDRIAAEGLPDMTGVLVQAAVMRPLAMP